MICTNTRATPSVSKITLDYYQDKKETIKKELRALNPDYPVWYIRDEEFTDFDEMMRKSAQQRILEKDLEEIEKKIAILAPKVHEEILLDALCLIEKCKKSIEKKKYDNKRN